MSKTSTAPAGIDPRGEEIVLRYGGAGFIEGIPARDLHGGDLNRVAYVRTFRAAHDVLETERRAWAADPSGPEPELRAPGIATAAELEAIAAELEASGIYSRNKSAAPAAPEGESHE